jgi:uncharacterized repeat protein (TIGR04076 family)
MARDPGVGYKIIATITDVKGTCNAGHAVGDRINVSCHDTGGLCGFFYHALFPDLQTFQFGGRMPWWEGDAMEAECPDAANRVTIRLERSQRD